MYHPPALLRDGHMLAKSYVNHPSGRWDTCVMADDCIGQARVANDARDDIALSP